MYYATSYQIRLRWFQCTPLRRHFGIQTLTCQNRNLAEHAEALAVGVIWTTKVATLLRIQLLAASLAGLVRRVNYCQGLLTLDFLWVCFPNRPQAGIHRRCYNLLMSRLVARSLQTWTPMLTVAAKDSLNQPPYTAGQNGINCVTL